MGEGGTGGEGNTRRKKTCCEERSIGINRLPQVCLFCVSKAT